MQHLLRRENKSDGTYEHILEIHLEKKDIRRLYKKKQRFVLDMKDITANEEIPIKLTEVIIIGVVKERRTKRGEKISDRRRSKGKAIERNRTREELPEEEES